MTSRPSAEVQGDDVYYRHAGRIGPIRQISLRARMAVFRLFMERLRPTAATSVLDVGVSLDVSNPEANVLEQFYPHRERLVCAGIGDGTEVQKSYPGVRFVQIEPHRALPFRDGEFDICYSNAVVEHAGSREQQRQFIAELCRVARHVFVVAPNRLFPIEHHTGLPLIHYLPLPAFRGLLRRTPFAYWAEEAHLNPLDAADFEALFPPAQIPEIIYAGLGLAAFKSNLVAIA